MKWNRFTLILALLPCFAHAQTGKIMEHLAVTSKALAKNVNYTIYFPPDYESSQRNYPVVYLLRGYTEDDSGWLQFGEVNRYADKAITSNGKNRKEAGCKHRFNRVGLFFTATKGASG